MPDVNWTPAQQCAISSRGGPLLVSAAAGSGKTAVLVQRIINIITDPDNPCDVDRFLVVTFTTAAADEMKQRINARIAQLLKQDPFNENLLRQQLLLGKAQISTIDSFCHALSKEYFPLLDIPADFRIADEEELTVLRNAAMDTVFEFMYDSGDEGFLRLSDTFSDAHSDAPLQKIVFALYEFLRSQPFPKRWLTNMMKMYENVGEPGQTIWGRQLRKYAQMNLEFLFSCCTRAMEEAAKEPKVTNAYMPALEEYQSILKEADSLLKKGVWDDICTYLNNAPNPKFGQVRKATDEEKAAAETVKAYRELIKKGIPKLAKLFSKNSDSFTHEIAGMKPMANALFSLVLSYEQEYRNLKTDRSVADYADLEHWALQLLVRDNNGKTEYTETASQIASRFDYVMVDEYQDANLIQDTIFNAVSGNDKRLFVVGDVKQSIYRFRQAMPEIFISRRDGSMPYSPEKDEYPSRVNLDANFRSRADVTDCINFVFSSLMSKEAGEIDYTDEEALKPRAAYPDIPSDSGKPRCAAAFSLLETGDVSDEEKIAAEARHIGEMIYKMMSCEYVTEGGSLRRPTYGDFCVLMRSIKDSAPIYIREFMKLGIPTECEKGETFFSQPEIRLMISLLRAIDNPARDIPMAAALISPIFGYTPEEIAVIRAKDPYRSLFEVILDMASAGDSKAGSCCSLMEKLRCLSGSLSADDLITRIYDETLLPEIVLSGSDGEYRQKNLRLLVQYARKYEGSGFRGLSGFVSFLDKLAENERDLAAADRREKNSENAVHIMTIHKSKGLEYPICIISALGKEFNSGDMKEKILLDPNLGIGMDILSPDGSYRYKGLTRTAVENAKKTMMVSEELRMLYVAMTRAKEKLVLVAAVKNAEKKLSSAAKRLVYNDGKISPFTVLSSQGLSDMLLPCLMISESGEELRKIGGYTGAVCENDISRWNIGISAAKFPDPIPGNTTAIAENPISGNTTAIAEDPIPGNTTAIAENPIPGNTTAIAENPIPGNTTAIAEDPISGNTTAIAENPIPGNTTAIAEDPTVIAAQTEEYKRLILQRLTRRYAYSKDVETPVKFTASELTERESGLEFAAVSRPDFMNEGGMSAAEKGTAMHAFAQFCDFEAARISVEAEKARLVSGGFMDQRKADSLDLVRIDRFLHSQLSDEIISADRVLREYRFMVELPRSVLREIFGEASPGLYAAAAGNSSVNHNLTDEEPLILQGAIDCLYESNGEITIVDYKTDRVKTAQELTARYAPQLMLYKYAADQIFCQQSPTGNSAAVDPENGSAASPKQRRIARCVLYSFALGEEIEVEGI